MADIDKKDPNITAEPSSSGEEQGEHHYEIDPVVEKRLVRKIDARMSILVLIYIMYLDRNNVAAARLKGFEEDLNLQGNQYQTVLSILYVGYVGFQIPSNIFLNRIGKPSLYLGVCMSLWGMISVLTGIVHNYEGALMCRLFIGFVEAAFFPGALFILSKWYKKSELALRTAVLYIGNLFSNALNGLLASGILDNMEGVLGHRGWHWLFFIEGAITIAIAVIAIFVLPDFPENASLKWLTPEEKEIAIKRMAIDGGQADLDQSSDSPFHGFKQAMMDYKVWLLAIYMSSLVLGLGFNQFFPTLAAALGYNNTVTLLLVAPPWIFTCILGAIACWSADRFGEKYYHSVIFTSIGIVGFIIAIAATGIAPRYVSLFLMASAYVALILSYTWVSTTIPRPPAKRAVALAFTNSVSNCLNIAVPYTFPTNWGPYYRNSWIITICAFGLAMSLATILRIILGRLNKKMDEGTLEISKALASGNQAPQIEGFNSDDADAAKSGWRYTL